VVSAVLLEFIMVQEQLSEWSAVEPTHARIQFRRREAEELQDRDHRVAVSRSGELLIADLEPGAAPRFKGIPQHMDATPRRIHMAIEVIGRDGEPLGVIPRVTEERG
jgi:hypothetical protein